MKKEFRIRYTIIGIMFTIIMGLLVMRLFNLQFVHGEEYLAKEQTFSQRNIRLTGPRGKILDTNGLPLAYNKTSYNVEFARDPSVTDRQKYTQSIMKTIDIIEQHGEKTISTFAIWRMDNGTYDFYWPGIDKVNDKKIYDARVDEWKKENCISKTTIDKTASPETLFKQCRKYYCIPEDASYEEAYKILSVWQEIRSTYFASYIPVTLAENVDYNTVAEISIDSYELPGIQITQSSTRVYPNGSMAAHIIGYMGRMLDEPTIVAMEGLGYSRDDLIGISGIEKTQEVELSGNTTERTGTKVVEVDNLGNIAREISSDNKSPKPGNNVMLTLDSGLQKTAEEALKENIAIIKAKQETVYRENKAKYDLSLQDRAVPEIHWASAGAVVVMSVQTGDILAMASYPTFDPNMFTGGISQADYDKLFKQGTTSPLFNNAISSRGTPGSVFKMVTGLAGLMESQITLNTTISDGGEYRKYITDPNERGPTCWVYPYVSKHKDQTIVLAIQNSCNYFFYTVAGNLGIDRLNKWADLLGLTSKTNVELPNEVAGQVGNQNTLYSPSNMSGVAALVKMNIINLLMDKCRQLGLDYKNAGKINNAALEMMGLVNQSSQNMGPDIRAILKNELKFTSGNIISTGIDAEISRDLTEIIWNPNYTVEAGIGQSVTMLTPIGMARYVSALVNGGNVYEARLVKAIIPPGGSEPRNTAPKLIRNLNVPPDYLAAIKEGMKKVVSDEEGTATSAFANFPYQDKMGGKTGTAQVNKNIDLENNSWFVSFAPFDKPEIAVVVYIPSGYQGIQSSYTAKAVIQYYLDKKYQVKTPVAMPQLNTLVK